MFFILLFPGAIFAAGVSEVKRGDNVILIRPLDDGITYTVQTPQGRERWRDRDLYHFAAYQETCTVIESLGSEVLLYVPIMDAKYWFVVEQTKVKGE